jgi:serine/tyrosine/threonine adenylyltransferase
MDYGPFGFLEEYDPLFAKWTGSGQHFGFMNQPSAGYANYGVLVESIVPVIAAARGLDEEQEKELQTEFLESAAQLFQSKLDEVMRTKLGFDQEHDAADEIWEELEPLLRNSRVDWTLFFRELSYVVRDMSHVFTASPDNAVASELVLDRLIGSDATRDGSSPFYESLPSNLREQWISWIQKWISALSSATLLSSDGSSNESTAAASLEATAHRMLTSINPKFVLREWMLVDAYQRAARGDEREVNALHQLIQRPYDEGTTTQTNRYYRRAPDEALVAAGTAFMSCSS